MRMIVICGSAVLAGALFGTPAAAQSSAFLAANLLGQDVPNGAGDDKGSANFNGEVDLKRNRLCYYLDMDGVAGANAVHIHQKDQALTDPPTLPLQVPGPGGDEVCVNGDNAVLSAIAKTPGDYYIDIHSADHPDGAVRGVLKE
ncbi:MAG TPA: CHRD domain-containing protein [Croceibacterium sp.]|nr:CHRD domain-containing protein [Croceibacterium sp.]